MEWTRGWREKVWAELDQPWDLIIIGGGISGLSTAWLLRAAQGLGATGVALKDEMPATALPAP